MVFPKLLCQLAKVRDTFLRIFLWEKHHIHSDSSGEPNYIIVLTKSDFLFNAGFQGKEVIFGMTFL